MTEHPLLLSTPMVLAFLAGRKRVTRRIPGPTNSLVDGRRVSGKKWKAYDLDLTRYQVCELEDAVIGFAIWSNSKKTFVLVEPIYQPGDTLILALELSGYDVRYAADILGNILTMSSGQWKAMKARETAGYLRLTLRKGGEDVNRTVHSVVCTAWHEKPNSIGRPCVRHLDGNSLNNEPSNLAWGSYSNNWDDRKVHGNGIHERHHAAKINMKIAQEMRFSGKNASQLSKIYGINAKTISRILKNETWVDDYNTVIKKPFETMTAEISSVNCEHLDDITEEQAIDEGIEKLDDGLCPWKHYHNPDSACFDAKTSFMTLWESIHGLQSWYLNPPVYAINFNPTRHTP